MIREVLRTLSELWREPAGRGLLVILASVFAGASAFYRFVEDWSWLDSLYFVVVTLTTVGYGDLTPATDLGKAATIVLILTGVGYILAFLNYLVSRTEERRRERHSPEDDPPA